MELFAPVLADEQFPRLRMHEYVGLALQGLGDARGAVAYLERFEGDRVKAMTFGWSAYDWLRCLTLLAELYRDSGRAADAGASLRRCVPTSPWLMPTTPSRRGCPDSPER